MGPMPPVPPQQQAVYDAPNCDYDPPSYMEQNFGNPYDCPENMYNGSMMSSVGYSQVSEQPLPQQPKLDSQTFLIIPSPSLKLYDIG